MLSRDLGIVALALALAAGSACVVQGSVSDPQPGANANQVPALGNQVPALGTAGGADFEIIVNIETFTALAGGTFRYTVWVTNHGPNAGETSLTIDLDPYQTLQSWSCGNPANCPDGASGTDPLDLQGLTVQVPANIAEVITVDVRIDADAPDTMTLTATSSSEDDTNAANNQDTHVHDVVHRSELHLTKSDDQAAAPGGSALTYSILIENFGPSDAPSVSISDDVSALPFLSVEWSCDESGGGTCGTEGGTGNVADVGSVPANASLLYTLTGYLDPCFTGVVSNTATIAADDLALGSVTTASDETLILGVGAECEPECECDCDDGHHGQNGAGHHEDGNGHGHNSHDDDGDGDDDHRGNGHHKCDCECDEDQPDE